jgi:hypothetical protein
MRGDGLQISHARVCRLEGKSAHWCRAGISWPFGVAYLPLVGHAILWKTWHGADVSGQINRGIDRRPIGRRGSDTGLGRKVFHEVEDFGLALVIEAMKLFDDVGF